MRIAALSLFALCALLVCAAGAQRALAAPTPAPSDGLVAAPEDSTVTKIARAELDAWTTGNLDLSYYAPTYSGYFTADIKQKVKGFLTGLGPIKAFTYLGKLTHGDQWAYAYLVTGAAGKANELIRLGTDGKINFIYFTEAQ